VSRLDLTDYPAPKSMTAADASALVGRLADTPEPPPAPVFTADTSAPLPERVARLLAHKVASLEAAAAGGGDVPVLELARLADQVAGRTTAPEDDNEYDLALLTDEEAATLNALTEKARRVRR
jgi:hypothetical protein